MGSRAPQQKRRRGNRHRGERYRYAPEPGEQRTRFRVTRKKAIVGTWLVDEDWWSLDSAPPRAQGCVLHVFLCALADSTAPSDCHGVYNFAAYRLMGDKLSRDARPLDASSSCGHAAGPAATQGS